MTHGTFVTERAWFASMVDNCFSPLRKSGICTLKPNWFIVSTAFRKPRSTTITPSSSRQSRMFSSLFLRILSAIEASLVFPPARNGSETLRMQPSYTIWNRIIAIQIDWAITYGGWDDHRFDAVSMLVQAVGSTLENTSNARRHDSLDPRLNVLESLFTVRFVSRSHQIRINENIIVQPWGSLCT